MKRHQHNGFTLLEVLVALAVIAVAMGAIIGGAGASVGNAVYLKERTLGHWVAMNKVAEFQLDRNWPGVGVRKGDYEMANHEWHWEAEISDTEDADVRRIDLEVFTDSRSGSAVARIVAYLGKPQ